MLPGVAPRLYRIVIEGTLGAAVASSFDGMSYEYAEGNTVIAGVVRDQAQLHGSSSVSSILSCRC
jgi:hypothetical protein